MSDIIRRIQKKFRRVRHSKTKIMNGKGNARKLITPNKRPKGPTLWDRLLAGRAEGKGDDYERYGAPSCGRYYRNDVCHTRLLKRG